MRHVRCGFDASNRLMRDYVEKAKRFPKTEERVILLREVNKYNDDELTDEDLKKAFIRYYNNCHCSNLFIVNLLFVNVYRLYPSGPYVH